MSLLLSTILPASGTSTYYTEKWLVAVRAHTTYLTERKDTTIKPLTEQDTYRYRNDINSLFVSLRIPQQYHVAYMIINGIDNPQHLDKRVTRLILPTIDALVELHNRTF